MINTKTNHDRFDDDNMYNDDDEEDKEMDQTNLENAEEQHIAQEDGFGKLGAESKSPYKSQNEFQQAGPHNVKKPKVFPAEYGNISSTFFA